MMLQGVVTLGIIGGNLFGRTDWLVIVAIRKTFHFGNPGLQEEATRHLADIKFIVVLLPRTRSVPFLIRFLLAFLIRVYVYLSVALDWRLLGVYYVFFLYDWKALA